MPPEKVVESDLSLKDEDIVEFDEKSDNDKCENEENAEIQENNDFEESEKKLNTEEKTTIKNFLDDILP